MTTPTTAVRWPTYWALGMAVLAAALGFWLCVAVSSQLSLPPLAAYVLGFACVTAASLGAALCMPRPTSSSIAVIVIALCLVVASRSLGPGSVSSQLVLVALLSAAPLIGAAVGSRIEHPGHLMLVVLVSTFADTFSVAHPEGPSALLAKSEAALSLVAVPWPMLGTESIEAFVGAGDLVFAGLYVAACRAHALSLPRTLIALACAFAAAMLSVLATALPVPVLPFMGVALLLVHPEARLPPPKDRKRAWKVAFAICAVFSGLLLYRLF